MKAVAIPTAYLHTILQFYIRYCPILMHTLNIEMKSLTYCVTQGQACFSVIMVL